MGGLAKERADGRLRKRLEGVQYKIAESWGVKSYLRRAGGLQLWLATKNNRLRSKILRGLMVDCNCGLELKKLERSYGIWMKILRGMMVDCN